MHMINYVCYMKILRGNFGKFSLVFVYPYPRPYVNFYNVALETPEVN